MRIPNKKAMAYVAFLHTPPKDIELKGIMQMLRGGLHSVSVFMQGPLHWHQMFPI